MEKLKYFKIFDIIYKTFNYFSSKNISNLLKNRIDISSYKNNYFIALGKGVLDISQHLTKDIHFTQSIVISNREGKFLSENIEYIKSSHPLPNKNSYIGGKKVVTFLKNCEINSQIVILIAGGASAMLELPKNSIEINQLRYFYNLLINCGAPIETINILRKKISQIKGGKLLKHIKKGIIIKVFILSDVLNGGIETVASAPFIYKNIDIEVEKIFNKYPILKNSPKEIKKVLLKKDKPIKLSQFIDIKHQILLNNNSFLEKLNYYGSKDGFKVIKYPYKLINSVEIEVDRLLKFYRSIDQKGVMIISGGEVTVKVDKMDQKGGRLHHLTTLMLNKIVKKGLKNDPFFISFGTDGVDGTTDRAGAFFTPEILIKMKQDQVNIDRYIKNFNTFELLKHYNLSFKLKNRSNINLNDIQILVFL